MEKSKLTNISKGNKRIAKKTAYGNHEVVIGNRLSLLELLGAKLATIVLQKYQSKTTTQNPQSENSLEREREREGVGE